MSLARFKILGLPLELFQSILAEAIRVRGLKRALRLRLVNQFFATQVIQTIHEHRLLDDSDIAISALGNLGAEYLTRRLINNLPLSPGWASLRRIAAQLAPKDDQETYKLYLKELCSRISRSRRFTVAAACLGHTNSEIVYHEESYKWDLLAAAIYLNNTPMLAELAHLGQSCGEGIMLGDPYAVAIICCNSKAFELLLRENNHDSGRYLHRLLPKVTEYGTLDMLEKWLQLDEVKLCSARTLEKALFTPKTENFDMLARFIEERRKDWVIQPSLSICLRRATRKGWEEMVRHLLSLGAPAGGYNLLSAICRGGFENIVRMLPEHGAKFEGYEVANAAKEGRWEMVRLLVDDYGADINDGDPPPVVSAVAYEREDIFRELLQRGAILHNGIGAKAVYRARKDGLESMLLLLQEHGIDITEVTKQATESAST